MARSAISKPVSGKLWHFDTSLESTDGIRPLEGAVATLRPNEGRFGGAVAVEEDTTNLLGRSRPVFGVTGRGLEFTAYGWEDGWYKLGIGGVWTGGTYPYIIAIQNVSFTGGTRYSATLVGKTNVPHKFNTLFGSINYVNAPILSGDRHSRQVLNDGSIKVQRLNFGYVDSTNQAGYISMRPISDGTTFDPTTDFIWVKEVQVEQKPFATSFVDGTRPDGILAYPIALPENHTIACYRKSHTDEGYRHVVKRSDGKVFVDGVEDSDYDVGWIAGRNLLFNSDKEYSTTSSILFADILRDTPVSLVEGETYTLSFETKADSPTVSSRIFLNNSLIVYGAFNFSTEWTRFSLTFVYNGDSYQGRQIFPHLYPSGGGTKYVRRFKLEKGNKATDWTPAPEDLGYSDDYLMFSNQTGLIDELLILPYAATEDKIQQWYQMTSPFYEPEAHLYQCRILDKDRRLRAVLPGVRWHYTRRINEATNIEIYIPKETIDEYITPDHALYGFFAPNQPFVVQGKPAGTKPNKTKYAEIASYIQIYKGDKLKVSGKINSRTLGEIVTVSAYTEEILLESNLTPAQYGKVWDGWDLADVARDLLDGWHTLRVKAQEQWQDRMVASSNVDLTTNPGHVMLAKRSNGRYYDSGYITLKFNKSEITNFKSWDRVRWSADSEEPVKTSIQISTNGTSFSDPFDGGLPEEIGYYIGGDHDQIYIRINLYTSDTESEDENGNKVGVTPTVFSVELIARTERGELVAGNIPPVAGVTVKGLSADYASALSVLVQACEQVGWEFNVFDGKLNLVKELGVDRTKDFVLRAGSNIEITALGDDDGELCNVLTAYGPGQGINRMEITLRDEASIAEFGEYPLAVAFEVESLTELQQKAQEFLNENNSPKTQFEIAVVFDHGREPEYGLGDKVRVADPNTGIVTSTRIMAEQREYNEQGLTVHLELGKVGLNLQKALERESKPQKGDPGQPAPRMLTRYAPTESGPWHYVFTAGDKWMQTSTDGGNLWSPPIKIVGEDGQDGKDGLPGPPGQDGEQGPKGDPGPGTPYLGEHDPTKIYYNRSNRRDVVHIVENGQTKYYIYKGPDGVSGAWNPDNWEYYGDTLDFVATKLLLAEDASITKTLNVGQGGTSRAGVSGEGNYRFWAGSEVPADAPFSVDETGHMITRSQEIISEDGGNSVVIKEGRLSIYKNGEPYHAFERFEIGLVGHNETIDFSPPFSDTPEIYLTPVSVPTYSGAPAYRDLSQRFVCQVSEKTASNFKARVGLLVENGYSFEGNFSGGELAFSSSYVDSNGTGGGGYNWYDNPDGITIPDGYVVAAFSLASAGVAVFTVTAAAYVFHILQTWDFDRNLLGTRYVNVTDQYAVRFSFQMQKNHGTGWINVGTNYTVDGSSFTDPTDRQTFIFSDVQSYGEGIPTDYRIIVNNVQLPIGHLGPVTFDHVNPTKGWGWHYWEEGGGPVTLRRRGESCEVALGISDIHVVNTSDQLIEGGTAQYFAIKRY